MDFNSYPALISVAINYPEFHEWNDGLKYDHSTHTLDFNNAYLRYQYY